MRLINHQGKTYRSIITLLALLLALTALALASCGESSNEFAEAETEVAGELDALKSGSGNLPAVADFSDEVSESLLASYAEKLKDFDYIIAGSGKSEDGKDVVVTVNITTYDFGSVYLETWNDWMKIEESLRSESHFYNDLLTRFASMSAKSYTGQAEIVCTKDEEGNWTTDIKTNPKLINAISGGMLDEMTELAEEQ